MSAVQQSPLGAARTASPAAAPGVVPRRRPAPPRPALRVVRAPAHGRTRMPFVVLCMAVLAVSLLGVLLLHTAMAQGEYQRVALQRRLVDSVQGQQQIATELRSAESSARLAEAAAALGMVPTSHGAYLRLADGVVLGDPVPAGAQG